MTTALAPGQLTLHTLHLLGWQPAVVAENGSVVVTARRGTVRLRSDGHDLAGAVAGLLEQALAHRCSGRSGGSGEQVWRAAPS